MNTPAAELYEAIAHIDEALEPFTGPQVEERPGLRWMHRTLQQRRDHILSRIARTERSTLTVRVRTAAGSSAVPAVVVSSVLDRVQQALYEASTTVSWPDGLDDAARRDAVTLVVGDAAAEEDEWAVELHRPVGPFSAQPLTADGGALAVDAALAALLRAVEPAPGALGTLVLDHGLSIDLATAPATGEAAAASIDRHTLRSGE
ncbi:MAG TPA: hypothetical protein VFZ70_09580 [Euzebyales bacterium]